MHTVRIDLADIHEFLDLGNGDGSACCHLRVELRAVLRKTRFRLCRISTP